jgi:hypothetical protein
MIRGAVTAQVRSKEVPTRDHGPVNVRFSDPVKSHSVYVSRSARHGRTPESAKMPPTQPLPIARRKTACPLTCIVPFISLPDSNGPGYSRCPLIRSCITVVGASYRSKERSKSESAARWAKNAGSGCPQRKHRHNPAKMAPFFAATNRESCSNFKSWRS